MPPRKTTKSGKPKTENGILEMKTEVESCPLSNGKMSPEISAIPSEMISTASICKPRVRRRRSIPQRKNNGAVFSRAESISRQKNFKKSSANNSSSDGNKVISSPLSQQQITQYFPIRRSSRKIEAEIKKEDDVKLEKFIDSKWQDGLEIQQFEGKGRGIVATQSFRRKDFVIEYAGELVDITEAKGRETEYLIGQKGCYMYYFNHRNKNFCVDATKESGLFGRLVNHSRRKPNCVVKVFEVKGRPHLILTASRDISIGEEILYDYGDRSKESLDAHPWLAL